MTEVEDEILFCYRHPNTETTLRCYQCGKPICAKCVQRTPVGYICPDCRRGRKQQFDRSRPADYILAGSAALILGGLASIVPLLGSWWFALFLSPLSGTLISEVVWRLVGRRHGEYLWLIVNAGIVVGSLPVLGLGLLQLPTVVRGNIWGLRGILVWALHVAMAIGAATARLRLT